MEHSQTDAGCIHLADHLQPLQKSVLSHCWQDEHHILTIIAQQGIWAQWLGSVTHEDAGWPAPAWAH